MAQPILVREPVPVEGIEILGSARVSGELTLFKTILEHEYVLSNPYSQEMRIALRYSFNGKPDLLEIHLNNQSVNPDIIYEDEFRTEYRVPVVLMGNQSAIISAKMEYPTRIRGFSRRLWGDTYYFYLPISIEADRNPVYIYGGIEGKIRISADVKKVSCVNCVYNEGENTVKINLSARRNPNFSIEIQTKRIPYKAGAFYLLMVMTGFIFALKKKMEH